MSNLVLSPQLSVDGGETPSEIGALRSLALDHHSSVLEARQVVRARNAYMGRLDDGRTILPWKPNLVHPKVNEVVERFAAILTDSRVKFEPVARNDEDTILAEMLIAGTDFEWERQRMDIKMQVASRAVMTDGTTLLYTGLDPLTGECLTRNLSPFSFVPAPASTDDDDMPYCFIKTPMTRAQIEAKWPEHVEEIFRVVGQASAPHRDENTFNQQFHDPRVPSPGSFGTSAQNMAGTLSATDFISPQNIPSRAGGRYRVEEWHFAKGEDRELTVDLADGTQMTVELPSTRGRRIILIEGHYFPFLDEEEPFDHGMIPVSRMAAINLMGEFLALPYIYPLLDTAEQLADIDNQIMANVRLMMHPIWLVPFESRIDFKKFFSAPGTVLPYRAPHKPEAHVPPALPSYVFELRRIKQQEFDDASGINDISRGNFSGGLADVSGKAVQQLMDPTYTRMRPIQLSTEYAVTRWGQQTMCNIMQYWSEERWRRVLPAHLANLPLPWLMPNEQTGERDAVDKYLPEIRMAAGSNLPQNKQAAQGLAFNLFDRAAFGPPGTPEASKEIMKATDYPDAERVAEAGAMAQQRMQMEQAAMQGQQDGAKAAEKQNGGPPKTGNKALGGERSPAADQAVMTGTSGAEP